MEVGGDRESVMLEYNRRMLVIGAVATLLLGLTGLCGCEGRTSYPPGGPYYYKGWESNRMPYRPAEKISHAEAEQLGSDGHAYYIAHFDEAGRLSSFARMFDGDCEWTVAYEYRDATTFETKTYTDGTARTTTYGP